MPGERSEGPWVRFLVGTAILAGLLGLVFVPLYLYAEPRDRPIVIRVGGAFVVGVAMLRLRGMLQGHLEAQPPSNFEQALRREPPTPREAPLYLKLRDEVRYSTTSQAYFVNVLWPRLVALRASLAGRALTVAPPQPRGRPFGRGPSLAILRTLIAGIEGRR